MHKCFDDNMIRVNNILLLSVVICSAFIHDGTSSFMFADEKDSECVGSIILNDYPSLTFHSNVSDINYKVWMVRAEGCGCFRLFQRSEGRGRSVKINQHGLFQINLGRLRSIFTEDCFMEETQTCKQEYVSAFDK